MGEYNLYLFSFLLKFRRSNLFLFAADHHLASLVFFSFRCHRNLLTVFFFGKCRSSLALGFPLCSAWNHFQRYPCSHGFIQTLWLLILPLTPIGLYPSSNFVLYRLPVMTGDFECFFSFYGVIAFSDAKMSEANRENELG